LTKFKYFFRNIISQSGIDLLLNNRPKNGMMNKNYYMGGNNNNSHDDNIGYDNQDVGEQELHNFINKISGNSV
jgi:hypothetical protein